MARRILVKDGKLMMVGDVTPVPPDFNPDQVEMLKLAQARFDAACKVIALDLKAVGLKVHFDMEIGRLPS